MKSFSAISLLRIRWANRASISCSRFVKDSSRVELIEYGGISATSSGDVRPGPVLSFLKAVKICADEGIQTNVTLVFSPNQAILAAKAGATFVSPFIGRLDDIGQVGMEIIEAIAQIYANYGFETEIIVASIRHPIHVYEAALIGADIATIPPDVLDKMVNHPLTDIGIKKFLDDWKKVPKK